MTERFRAVMAAIVTFAVLIAGLYIIARDPSSNPAAFGVVGLVVGFWLK